MQARCMTKLTVVMLLIAACGSKNDRSGEGSGSSRTVKEDLATVPAGTYVAKALHMPSDGTCTAQIAGGAEVDNWKDERQKVEGFAIDKRVASCADFMLCVDQGGCVVTKNDFRCESDGTAVAYWSTAEAYCAWRKQRLPTYLEWQAAVRGPTGITTPNCSGSGSNAESGCVTTSPFGVVAIVAGVLDLEFTRSSECWSNANAEPDKSVVGISLMEKSFSALMPVSSSRPSHGSFRCARD